LLEWRLDKLMTRLARDEAAAFCAAGLDRWIYIRHSLWVAGTWNVPGGKRGRRSSIIAALSS
jgi:hypothetical protein